MKELLSKTFGGLTPQYLFRQYVFGAAICALMVWAQMSSSRPDESSRILIYGWFVLSTILYPYSRFVYEGIVDFVVGENEFWISGILLLGWKFAMMVACWGLAWVIAPFGLAYLYFSNRGNPAAETAD